MKHRRKLIVSALLIIAHPLCAQFTPTISVGGEYMQSSKTEFDETDQGFTLRKASADIAFTHPYASASSATLGCTFSRLDYDFDRSIENPLPWEKINEVNAVLIVDHNISPTWNAIGLGLVRSAYDTEARFQDSITWGAGFGIQNTLSEKLSVVYGLGYLTRLERDGVVLPIFGIEWQISDRLKMSGILGFDLEYDLWGDGSGFLNAGLECELTDFRVRKDPVSGRKTAIEPTVGALYLSYSHKISEQASFFLKVSSYGEQEYKTYSNDREIASMDADAFVLYGAGFCLVF